MVEPTVSYFLGAESWDHIFNLLAQHRINVDRTTLDKLVVIDALWCVASEQHREQHLLERLINVMHDRGWDYATVASRNLLVPLFKQQLKLLTALIDRQQESAKLIDQMFEEP